MARATLRAKHYHSCIIMADLDRVEDLKQISELRRVAMRVWMIVLCDLRGEGSLLLVRRQDVDAGLCAPFSMLDLTSRQHFHFDQDRRFEMPNQPPPWVLRCSSGDHRVPEQSSRARAPRIYALDFGSFA